MRLKIVYTELYIEQLAQEYDLYIGKCVKLQ